jgi:glucose-1-phosphate cytidylyltransferase
MKAVILAGGLGTRISEESQLRPKPMIEIGGRPILWHIMKFYSHHGVRDFVICLGYKGYMIKEYFANIVLHSSDVTIDAAANTIEYHQAEVEPWRITLADTGEHSLTGGRLKRAGRYLNHGETFCMTYGDGLADLDLPAALRFHKANGRAATLTAVIPPGRYGAVDLDGGVVRQFLEKPPESEGYVNGGFFVLEPSVLDRIDSDMTAFEGEPLEGLARDHQLAGYRHSGFWQAMDTLRDKNYLEELWRSGRAPWRVWA